MTIQKSPRHISVIGAGIMGIMNAYTLARKFPEAEVTLYDKNGFPADNASFMAGGMIAPLSEMDHMPAAYMDAGFASIDIWHDIHVQTDTDFEFSAQGSLFISHPQDRHLLERFKSILPEHAKWRALTGQHIEQLEPALTASTFHQGLFMEGEAHLHPQKTIKALLDMLKLKKIETVEITQKKSDWIIDCRGLMAKDTLPNLRGVKGEILIVRNPDFTLSRPLRLMHPRYPLYIVPRADNIFMIGATIIESEQNPHVSIRSGMELMSALYSIHKSFGDAEILEMKAGLRPSMKDNLPQITVEGNIIRCNGLFRHGFLMSPVMAECTAHIISGTEYKFLPLFMRQSQ